jgi:trimethylamine:corrinoid methyltransferase-like protein
MDIKRFNSNDSAYRKEQYEAMIEEKKQRLASVKNESVKRTIQHELNNLINNYNNEFNKQ